MNYFIVVKDNKNQDVKNIANNFGIKYQYIYKQAPDDFAFRFRIGYEITKGNHDIIIKTSDTIDKISEMNLIYNYLQVLQTEEEYKGKYYSIMFDKYDCGTYHSVFDEVIFDEN